MKPRIRLVIVLFAAGLLVGCSSSPDKKGDRVPTEGDTAESQTSAQELFVQGNKALDAKDFEGAVALYDEALQRDDERWDIYLNKAIAHSAKQQFSDAVAAIDQALANGGDDKPEVYFNLGNIYQNRGLYAQSVKAYRSALAVSDKPHIDSLINLAGALALMREYKKAAAAYEHLRTLVPDDPRVYAGLALAKQGDDKHEAALEFYEQANAIDPDYPQAWFNKAALLERMGRTDEAIESYKRYLTVDPEGPYIERATNRVEALRANQ